MNKLKYFACEAFRYLPNANCLYNNNLKCNTFTYEGRRQQSSTSKKSNEAVIWGPPVAKDF